MYNHLGAMKTWPNSKDGWIALALFPFKVYIVMAIPFLEACVSCKAMFQPGYYGYPHEARLDVCLGYFLCLAVLVFGTILQAIVCRGWSWIRTLGFLAFGFLCCMHLLTSGTMGR
jgi:hypothetical protein